MSDLWREQNEISMFPVPSQVQSPIHMPDMPGLEVTNYRAKQAIRPAMDRKARGDNRTQTGATPPETLMNVLRSRHRQAKNLGPLLADLLRSLSPYVLPLVPPQVSLK